MSVYVRVCVCVCVERGKEIDRGSTRDLDEASGLIVIIEVQIPERWYPRERYEPIYSSPYYGKIKGSTVVFFIFFGMYSCQEKGKLKIQTEWILIEIIIFIFLENLSIYLHRKRQR